MQVKGTATELHRLKNLVAALRAEVDASRSWFAVGGAGFVLLRVPVVLAQRAQAVIEALGAHLLLAQRAEKTYHSLGSAIAAASSLPACTRNALDRIRRRANRARHVWALGGPICYDLAASEVMDELDHFEVEYFYAGSWDQEGTGPDITDKELQDSVSFYSCDSDEGQSDLTADEHSETYTAQAGHDRELWRPGWKAGEGGSEVQAIDVHDFDVAAHVWPALGTVCRWCWRPASGQAWCASCTGWWYQQQRARTAIESKSPAAFVQKDTSNTKSMLKDLADCLDEAAFLTEDRIKLAEWVQSQRSEGSNHSAFGAPATAVYESQCGGTLDVLDDMVDKAEGLRSDLSKTEVNNRQNFEMLTQSLEDQAMTSRFRSSG